MNSDSKGEGEDYIMIIKILNITMSCDKIGSKPNVKISFSFPTEINFSVSLCPASCSLIFNIKEKNKECLRQ